MKIELKKPVQILALLTAILTFGMPFVTFAQQNSLQMEARVAAGRDAQADVNQFMWFAGTFVLSAIGGCLLGSVGIIGSSVYQPTPPASRFIGKSTEYIVFYTEAYKAKVQNHQLKSSALGCLGGSIIAAIIWAPYYQ